MSSIFDSIVTAVMVPAQAAAAQAPAPAPAKAPPAPSAPAAAARLGQAGSRPAPAARVGAAVSAAVTGAAAPAASPAASPAGQPATPAPARPRSAAEVEALIAAIAAGRKESFNWKQSIVDLMKLLNLDSSLGARKQLAQELGYGGKLDGSAEMNLWLHKQVMQKLASGDYKTAKG